MKKNLLQELFAQMEKGKHPANFHGTCQVELKDDSGSVSGFISYFGNEMHFSGENPGKADVVVTTAPETLRAILSNPDKFDLRNPEVLEQLTAEGDLDLAGFLFAMVKRPSKEVLDMMQEILVNTVNYKSTIAAIKRIHRPTEREVVDLLEQSIPFVITGALDNWSFTSMTLEQIKEEYGSVSLRPNVDKSKSREETFRDFIEKMEDDSGDMVYTYGCPLPLAIWAEFPLPYFEWELLTSPQIWMGSKTGDMPCTNLHRDCTHGMLSNLFGRKRLILFSPDQSDYVYPVPAFNTYQPCLLKDPLHVDMEKFPLYKHAVGLEVTIGPGEMLVIPAFWYHCVYALDNVFSVSFGPLWQSWKMIRSAKKTV